MLRITHSKYPVPVSADLRQMLVNVITPELRKLNIIKLPSAITINFRDPNYSAEKGGYRPYLSYASCEG